MPEPLADTEHELLSRYGSPIYVYRLERVAAALSHLRAMLPEPASILFSIKANPHPDVARVLSSSGCGAEVSSKGELTAALDAGFDASSCLYTGPAKSGSEIAAALAVGVRRFSAESVTDLARIGTVAVDNATTAECLIRVNATAHGATGIRMTGTPSQFGVTAHELMHNSSSFRDVPGIRIIGLHFFPVSNVGGEASLCRELEESIRLTALLRSDASLPVDFVSLGGGFASPYAQPGDRPSYPALRAHLTRALDEWLPEWRVGEPTVGFESGRYLVGECGTLLTTVMDVKSRDDRVFVLLDSGINHLGGLSGIGRMLPAAIATQISPATSRIRHHDLTREPTWTGRRSTLVGPLCTPADILGNQIVTGPCRAGDVLAIPNVGAYGLTASLVSFLSRPAPTEVVLQDNSVVSASSLRYHRVPS